MKTISIDGRLIGCSQPTYLIAEMSANHHQDFDEAKRIIKAAAEAGADAVKLQTYTADTITMDSDSEHFRVSKGMLWADRTLHDLYKEAATPWEWQPKLKKFANGLDLDLFSSPFDETAVDFLEEMNVPCHKIASFEIVDIPLIRKIAQTGKPIIMSTGMATLAEIDEAVRTIRETGNNQFALLKCTSAYPASPEEANLRTIPHLSEAFGVPAGLSDHTMGIAVPVAAVALGACIIEKHFTLSRDVDGPDSAFSLEPQEFKAMVDAVRIAEKALGKISYDLTEKEAASQVFRRSLYVVKDIKKGEKLTEKNVRSIRPGHGLHTRYYKDVLNRQANTDIERGTPLDWKLLS
ncbi:MAG: pseudaminic acid synthase [Bradymonadaceae bacterium]